MKKTTVAQNVKDVKIDKSDFILQHKNTKFTEIYVVNGLLGEGKELNYSNILGGYGKVMKCVHKSSGEVRAVKIMEKEKISPPEQVRLKYEIDILKNLTHPNILRLFEVFEDKKQIYLVTEFCSGGELFDEIQKRNTFTERDAAGIIKQLLSAIAYCHNQNVCHRDLKPENILMDENDKKTIKLIDFGTSQVFNEGEKMELVLGTPYYIAPEVLHG